MKKQEFEQDIAYLGNGNKDEGWLAGVPGKHVLETRRGGDMSAIDTQKGRVFKVGKKTFVSKDQITKGGEVRRHITKAPFTLLSVGQKKSE